VFSASRVTIGAGVHVAVRLRHRQRSRLLGSREIRARSNAHLTASYRGRRVAGAGAKVLDGVTIGSHAVIGAGAAARGRADHAVAVGVPARIVSSRAT
jgi:serine acetyltransferase